MSTLRRRFRHKLHRVLGHWRRVWWYCWCAGMALLVVWACRSYCVPDLVTWGPTRDNQMWAAYSLQGRIVLYSHWDARLPYKPRIFRSNLANSMENDPSRHLLPLPIRVKNYRWAGGLVVGQNARYGWSRQGGMLGMYIYYQFRYAFDGEVLSGPSNKMVRTSLSAQRWWLIQIPHYVVFLLLSIPGLFWLRRKWKACRTLSLVRAQRCIRCGYDLRAHQPGQRCPECGTVVPSPSPAAGRDPPAKASHL